MSKKKKNSQEGQVYPFAVRNRVSLIVITALLFVLIPVSYVDPAAWVGRFPLISAVLVPIVLGFVYMLLQDGWQKIVITKDKIVWEHGVWRWRRVVAIRWADILELRDDTSVFSVGRRYIIVAGSLNAARIRINGSLNEYRQLLRVVAGRVPPKAITPRAEKSLRRMGAIGG